MTEVQEVTITNVFGPLNRGDFELLQQLLDILRTAPSVDVHAVARDPDGCARHFPGVTFHPQPGAAAEIAGRRGRLTAVFRTGILFLAAWLGLAERLLPVRQRSALSRIRSADLVVACPGGYITSSSWSFYPQLAQLQYAVRRGKQVWLAPMSIGPAHGRIHRVLVRLTLRGAARVYVRESWSERFCAQLGIASTRSADLALRPARDWLCSEAPRREPVCITATVVRWEFPGEADPRAALTAYHEAMAGALNAISARFGLPVKLLLQVDNDRQVTESVAARLTVPHEVVQVETPGDYRRILSCSRLMIGSRFHSAVFSMSVGCPTIVISYLPKARFMMEDMGLGGLVQDIGGVSTEGLLRCADQLEDPASRLAERARDAILCQTEDVKNPFVTALRAVLPPAAGATIRA